MLSAFTIDAADESRNKVKVKTELKDGVIYQRISSIYSSTLHSECISYRYLFCDKVNFTFLRYFIRGLSTRTGKNTYL